VLYASAYFWNNCSRSSDVIIGSGVGVGVAVGIGVGVLVGRGVGVAVGRGVGLGEDFVWGRGLMRCPSAFGVTREVAKFPTVRKETTAKVARLPNISLF